MDRGIENLLFRLRRDLIRGQRLAPSASSSSAELDAAVDQALRVAYEAGRAEVERDRAPCEAVIRPRGAEDAAKCMSLAGHGPPHESADGWQWWSPADGSALAAVGRSDDPEATSRSGSTLGQVDVEGSGEPRSRLPEEETSARDP
jgi:hypothetical protein